MYIIFFKRFLFNTSQRSSACQAILNIYILQIKYSTVVLLDKEYASSIFDTRL